MLDLGKMWGLLKQGYGKLIQNYCSLLVNKMDFHYRVMTCQHSLPLPYNQNKLIYVFVYSISINCQLPIHRTNAFPVT